MSGIKKLDNGICVKISIYNGSIVDEVVYYRHSLELEMAVRWKWYFNYLVARIKVKHPRLRVELTMCAQTILAGEEYKQKKIKDLLKFYHGRLSSLERKKAPTDLFGFDAEEKEAKMQDLKEKIKQLEQGIYDGYVPVKYINNIKNWI